MSDELSFVPNEINLSNISALNKRQTLLEERRICELSELATEAAQASYMLISEGEMSVIDVLSLISESFVSEAGECHEGALDDNFGTLIAYIKTLQITDRVVFAELFRARLASIGVKITEESFLQASGAPSTFVYVKNSFADEAYDVFSQDFYEPRVRYAETIKDAIKLVRDGEVTYCLLPLEESGSRLPSVAELLFQDDLKIDAVTPVFGFDGTADMKYAVASRGFLIPKTASDDDRYLEIRTSSEESLFALLLAADKYGAKLYRINMHFFVQEGIRRPFYSIIFKEEGGDFSDLLTYLTLFVPSYTAVGIYKNLEM